MYSFFLTYIFVSILSLKLKISLGLSPIFSDSIFRIKRPPICRSEVLLGLSKFSSPWSLHLWECQLILLTVEHLSVLFYWDYLLWLQMCSVFSYFTHNFFQPWCLPWTIVLFFSSGHPVIFVFILFLWFLLFSPYFTSSFFHRWIQITGLNSYLFTFLSPHLFISLFILICQTLYYIYSSILICSFSFTYLFFWSTI